MTALRQRHALLFLLVFVPGCIFGGGNVPPTLGGGDDDTGNNGQLDDVATPNNGEADAANNGTLDAGDNNGTVDAGDDPDLGGVDQGDDNDVDEALCGNGVVDPMETCDIAATGADACPMFPSDCNPEACQQATVTGSLDCQSVCSFTDRTCGATDGCCPANCSADADEDCGAVCGNGIEEGVETCDGNCPTSCDDGNACTADAVTGNAASCNVACTNNPINSCVSGDGCCPGNCTSVTDNDCSASCGDGVLDTGETCDGNCPAGPADCDDNNACTTDLYSGSPTNCNAACTNTPVTACRADGCCAPGCNANNDPDCAPSCGNGITESGELCDGNCPASCDDGNVCTTDNSTGSAGTCDLVCASVSKTCSLTSDGCCPAGCTSLTDSDCNPICGNGVQESGESCDGNCPATCSDGNSCTADTLTGSPGSCNVTCTYATVTACNSGDGCCPAGCTSLDDSDCSASCGNNVVEGNEKCDGNCPTAATCAAISACHVLTGSAGQCNAECVQDPNCTPCDLNGACTCSAGQECIGGKCTASDGEGCTNACDEAAFCSVWGGSGWICDSIDARCYECRDAAQCEVYQACAAKSCVTPNTCTNATDPDAWCDKFKGADQVCVAGECRTKCNTAADCPLSNDACVGGYCELATFCKDARNPSVFCSSTGRGDYCSTSFGCLDACVNPCDCAPAESCLNTTTLDKGDVSLCRLPTPATCGLACDPRTFCQKSTNTGTAYCEDTLSGDFCTNYTRCVTKADCKLGVETCNLSDLCEVAPTCGVAQTPDVWCQTYDGRKGVSCNLSFRGGICNIN